MNWWKLTPTSVTPRNGFAGAAAILIAIDEVGYVPLAEVGAEFLFQVIAELAERTAVIVTTNLPFSERTQVIPNCSAVQSATGSHYRSSAYFGDRQGIAPIPLETRLPLQVAVGGGGNLMGYDFGHLNAEGK